MNTEMNEPNNDKTRNVTPLAVLRELLNGNFLLKGFIIKYYKGLLIFVFCSFLYIGNRYACEKQLATIVALQKELKDVKYEALSTSAELMQMSRQSNVQEALSEKGISLEISKTSPIIIKD